MRVRFCIKAIISILIALLLFCVFIPLGYCTTETRYMRDDLWTVNGLYGFKLTTAQSTTGQLVTVSYSGDVAGYWGCRVWKRSAAGTETEITGGSAVAVVSRSSDGAGIQSADWNCPETSLESTDAVVVRVYMDTSNPPTTLRRTFVSEQLGASKLNSATWTFYYYTEKSTAISAKTHHTDYNSHTVNGKTHRKHITYKDSSSSFSVTRTGTSTAYCGVRWFIVHSDGSENELGEAGTYKAIASRTTTGWAIGTYALSETNIATTDAVKVKFYFKLGSSSFTESDLAETFITTQLGSTKLYSTTLTVNYYLLKATGYWQIFFGWYWDQYAEEWMPYSNINGYKYEATTTLNFRQGTSTYNSRIENFAWTEAVTKTWHEIASWTFNLLTRGWKTTNNWVFELATLGWHNITSWNFNILSRFWQQITYWNLNVLSRMWSLIASWTLNLPTRIWRDIASLTFSLLTRSWTTITILSFYMATRIWQSITSLSFNLATMMWTSISQWIFNLKITSWNNIVSWIFQFKTMTWQTNAKWIFDLASLGWHNITSWLFNLNASIIDYIAFALGSLGFCCCILPLLDDDEKTKALGAATLILCISGLAFSILGLSYALPIASVGFVLALASMVMATKKD